MDCYGKFSEVTKLFFTLDKLMTMFNNFKVNLPQYHEMISIMIHKHVSTKPCLVLIY